MRLRSRRTVVVTGASAGVGRAAARAFAARGDRVALLARGRDGLAAAADEVQRAGGEALVVPVDMADPKAVEDAAEQVEETLGPIDVWVNNAFAGVFAPFMEISADEFRRVTEVTYLGYVSGTRAALRHMLPRDHGTIVQVGSALAYRGIPLQTAYCGAKHAIQGFNESLRCELVHQGSRVRTTMVQLPAVNTPQFDWVLDRLPRRARPVAPVYQPEVAARAIVHAAAHPRRREYWVGGSTAATLVANAVAPGVLDRYMARTGYDAQQSPDMPPPETANLWAPADGPHGHDYGAHGRFDEEALSAGLQEWLSRNRGRVGMGLAVCAAALAGRRLSRLTERPSRASQAPGSSG
ncbi:SDR family oxidoreductase [Streptomyces sp. NPDC002896]|uniref:SDR family oxidoreductase n=1 Tax=Streptomyces sp. NPDC002896 TaxID=3154438 RepID=UPI00331EC757